MQETVQIPLPNLPGIKFTDSTRRAHHKVQAFSVVANTMREKIGGSGSDTLDLTVLSSIQNQLKASLNTMPVKLCRNDKIEALTIEPESAPVEGVLRFAAYFVDTVPYLRAEREQIRWVNVLVYMDDQTIQINEPKVRNSGLPHGIFLKRQKVPTDMNYRGFVNWEHFAVGEKVKLFERYFFVFDADSFTREFYASNGRPLAERVEPPTDEWLEYEAGKLVKVYTEESKEFKEYCEVRLGGGKANKGLREYLDHDGQLLSFDAVWDDLSFAGGRNHYKINYYMSDDSVEVKEVHRANDGKDRFPLLLKRAKLVRTPQMSHTPGQLPRAQQCYEPRDFVIGNVIRVFGRDCVLVDCDAFTREYFRSKFGIAQGKIDLHDEAKHSGSGLVVPPHNGWGSETDSLSNCLAIVPKPPRLNLTKKFLYESIILRFTARILTPFREDTSKKFIISFYCGDDSLMVHLVPAKNSGIDGGKYLERRKYKNPKTGEFYQQNDMTIGATLEINSFLFQITSADEFTFKYMESHPAFFPLSDRRALLGKIVKYGLDNFTKSFLESVGREPINFEAFHLALASMPIDGSLSESFALFAHAADSNSQKVCPLNLLRIIQEDFKSLD